MGRNKNKIQKYTQRLTKDEYDLTKYIRICNNHGAIMNINHDFKFKVTHNKGMSLDTMRIECRGQYIDNEFVINDKDIKNKIKDECKALETVYKFDGYKNIKVEVVKQALQAMEEGVK